MNETKWTKGNWKLELNESWPFGFRISSGEREIVRQDGACSSTAQQTRADYVDGVGFDYHSKFTTRDQAIDAVAEQDANAHLIASAPELYRALEEIRETVKKRQLPITNEVWEIADAALTLARGGE